MISCNKKSLYLPPEMPAIHVEFTEYYFPDGKDYPSKTSVFHARKFHFRNPYELCEKLFLYTALGVLAATSLLSPPFWI